MVYKVFLPVRSTDKGEIQFILIMLPILSWYIKGIPKPFSVQNDFYHFMFYIMSYFMSVLVTYFSVQDEELLNILEKNHACS